MEPSDIELMYQWENDPETWTYSNTHTPFSRFHLEQFIMDSHCDVYTDKQLRLMIMNPENETVGCVDIFEFDPNNRRAGLGILIAKDHRKKGYAAETLDIIIDYARNTLHLHQLFCNIAADNKKSIQLFTGKGFLEAGVKKEWILINNSYVDELLFQLIFE